jgi:hypothetical protein
MALRGKPTKEKGSSPWGDRHFHEPGLGRCHDHGHLCLRRLWRDVFRYRENQAVDQVRRQIEMFALDLLLAIFPFGTNRNLTAVNADRHIHRMREGRPFLDMVVGDELEVPSLRKDCSLIIDRAVFETEEQPGCNPITTDDLEEVAHRKHAAFMPFSRQAPMLPGARLAEPYRGACFSTQTRSC